MPARCNGTWTPHEGLDTEENRSKSQGHATTYHDEKDDEMESRAGWCAPSSWPAWSGPQTLPYRLVGANAGINPEIPNMAVAAKKPGIEILSMNGNQA